MKSLTFLSQCAAGLAVAAVTAVALVGCPPMQKNLALTLTGLEPLGGDYVYEGWLIVDGAPSRRAVSALTAAA